MTSTLSTNNSSEEYAKWVALHKSDEKSTDPAVLVAQACFKNQIEDVERLLSTYQINVNLCCGWSSDPNGENFFPSTLLQHACRHGLLKLVKVLVNAGADVNAPNTSNHSIPLIHYFPLEVAYDYNRFEVMGYLISQGAKVNVLKDSIPLTSRIVSLIVKGDPRLHPKVLQLLLNEGGEIDCPNEEGFTPLKEALDHDAPSALIRFLIFNGANVNAKGVQEIAKKKKRIELIDSLVKVRDQALTKISLVKPELEMSSVLESIGKDARRLIHEYLIDMKLVMTKEQRIALPKTCFAIEKDLHAKKAQTQQFLLENH